MSNWRKIDQTWCNWPSQPKALIEMIGGSYLAATPNISYKILLESLSNRNFAVHAWSYIPGFDHQAQANEAWKALRKCRLKLESRIGTKSYIPIRLGHSLGCKLHLIAPDGGRKSKLFIGISFNNFKADSSIPILGKFKKRFNIQNEFSPSPKETMRLIKKNYLLPENLLIKFSSDKLDQTPMLLEKLKERQSVNDNSMLIELNGNHLTPASTGLKNIITQKNNNFYNEKDLDDLINAICKYALI